MPALLRGRQTQFYIDILYGVAFTAGFGYLLVFGMDARVAAFQGGIVLGYFLRVWENMHIYERILEEEVASQAQEHVEAEVESQVPEQVEAELESQAQEHVEAEVESQAQQQVERKVESKAEEHVEEEFEKQVADEVETRMADEAESELLDRIESIDEALAKQLREHLANNGDLGDEGESDE